MNLNRDVLDALAKELMERETLQADDIAKIFANVKKIPARKTWLSSDKRPVSKIPPIAIPPKASTAVAPVAAAKPKAVRKPRVKKEAE